MISYHFTVEDLSVSATDNMDGTVTVLVTDSVLELTDKLTMTPEQFAASAYLMIAGDGEDSETLTEYLYKVAQPVQSKDPELSMIP